MRWRACSAIELGELSRFKIEEELIATIFVLIARVAVTLDSAVPGKGGELAADQASSARSCSGVAATV